MTIPVDEYRFFREATLRICGSLDIQEALDGFSRYIETIIPSDGMCICYFDELTSSGVILAVSSQTPIPYFEPRARYSKSEWEAFHAAILAQGPTTIINDFDKAPDIYRVINRLHQSDGLWDSSLRLNLVLNNQDLGMLVISKTEKNAFTQDHARLLELLHDPFAVAMANWRQHLTLVRYQKTLQDDCHFYKEALRQQAGTRVIGAEKGLFDVMQRAARGAETTSPVMILGETGVGKEVVAGAIHNASQRREGPFIKVNCGAIPEHLIDSELFGHEKGAFTGALKSHRGRFERASGGTLFLDEVGELPLAAQVRLLRVLQNQELERVGGTEPIPVDVRVISATHRNLEEMVSQGLFRQDLWFRLNVFPIAIPPLRDRREDIFDLAHHFVIETLSNLGRHTHQEITKAGLQRLITYLWPGNVRELQNVVERELILTPQGPLEFRGLHQGSVTPLEPETAKPQARVPLEETIRQAIIGALKASNGRVQGEKGAAKSLGINPSTLRARMKKLGIDHRKIG